MRLSYRGGERKAFIDARVTRQRGAQAVRRGKGRIDDVAVFREKLRNCGGGEYRTRSEWQWRIQQVEQTVGLSRLLEL